ncbi:MAG TPA: hypothetical protein ENH82_17030 [bacterium]|nr:hypothetical protein [bacterium]
MQGKRTNLLKVALLKLFKHGFSSIIILIALFGVLISVNYVFAVKTSFIDITKNKIHSITDESKNLLDEIDYKINIRAFYLSKNQHLISMLLKLYRKENSNISFEVIDPLKYPDIAKKYDIELPRTIIVEGPAKITRLDPPPRGEHNSELEISTALYRIITDQEKKVYFTEGHGERGILDNSPDGLIILQKRLKEQNYLIDTINLQSIQNIPPDCSVLIITDPKSPFTDDEAKIIGKYMQFGGSILLLVSPGLKPNLDNVMDMHGLKFGDDFVYETASDRTTQRGPTSPICTPMDQSEITSNLTNQNIVFPGVRSINPVTQAGEMVYTRLLSSSENSWAETDIESAMEISRGKRPSRDENETKGPIIVAVATEIETMIPDTTSARGASKQIVRSGFFGSGGFITNTLVSQFPANINVFLNTINWVTRNEKVLRITPHAALFTPVELTRSERRMISWLSLFIFPITILMVGLIIWFRKR